MTYDTVASFAQVASLAMFVAMFLSVVTYALWPKNGPRFEQAQRRALDLDAPMMRKNGSALLTEGATEFPSPTGGEGTVRRAVRSNANVDFLSRGRK